MISLSTNQDLSVLGHILLRCSRKLVLNIHWKDWCWSWNSNTLATWCKELTHLKRPWCWERLKAGGEGDDRGWDGWMAPPTQWTWVWINSRNWWWTGRPGVLQSMESQRVVQDWVTEVNWTEDLNPLMSQNELEVHAFSFRSQNILLGTFKDSSYIGIMCENIFACLMSSFFKCTMSSRNWLKWRKALKQNIDMPATLQNRKKLIKASEDKISQWKSLFTWGILFLIFR